MSHQFLSINEQGLILHNEQLVKDDHRCASWLSNLTITDTRTYMTEGFIVEAFDDPYVVESVTPGNGAWHLLLPYGVQKNFQLNTLTLDEWDRFHGYTTQGIPFVMTSSAQAEFFDLVDSYDDDGFVYQGKTYTTPPHLDATVPVEQEAFWSNIYRTEKPGWDMGGPSPVFVDMIPRIKLPKSRIAVLGSGPGHDAALFAQHGHVVTAIDFSPDAITASQQRYANLKNITWMQADVFKLPRELDGQFDIVLEHTCFCAIDPWKRNNLVSTYHRLLHSQGQLLGVFFIMDKKNEPPFGASEWELRSRLQGKFQPLFWGRSHVSHERRMGRELLIFAQRK